MRLHFKEILKRDDDEPTLENLEMKCQLEIIQGQTFIKSRHLAQKPTRSKFILAYLQGIQKCSSYWIYCQLDCKANRFLQS